MYITVPVKDVAAAREFYPKMGFGKNAQLSNDQNAVVIIDAGIILMFVAEDFFKQNTGRDIADTCTGYLGISVLEKCTHDGHHPIFPSFSTSRVRCSKLVFPCFLERIFQVASTSTHVTKQG